MYNTDSPADTIHIKHYLKYKENIYSTYGFARPFLPFKVDDVVIQPHRCESCKVDNNFATGTVRCA